MNSTQSYKSLFICVCYSFLIFSAGLLSQQMTDFNQQVFPTDHALNMPIDSLPVHPLSDIFISTIGANKRLHPDFGDSWDDDGTIRPMGIPYNVVGSDQPLLPISWTLYGDESDPGPWPIPQNPFIEGVFNWSEYSEGDRHLLVIDSVANILYESGNVYGNETGTEWEGGCGAIFNLNAYNLRPETWTSADAAGLPIFPLLIRYDEVEKALNSDGMFHHAVRFTTDTTKREYIWPARHFASSQTASKWPPMGLRFRLKADFDISGFTPRMQVILRSMKKYGIILADNGSDWFFQGTHDSRWDNDEINSLKNIRGNNFEAVDISEWMDREGFDNNSAKVPSKIVNVDNRDQLSENFYLFQNYPNPFNPTTTIKFNIPSNGVETTRRVVLKIFDILGSEVKTLVNEQKSAGNYTVEWNGTNSSGYLVGSGVYICKISVMGNSGKNFFQSKKMIFAK